MGPDKIEQNLQKQFTRRFTQIFSFTITIVAVVVALHYYFFLTKSNAPAYPLILHIIFNLLYWWTWIAFLPVIFKLTTSIQILNRVNYWLIYFLAVPTFLCIIHQLAGAVLTVLVYHNDSFMRVLSFRILRNQWAWVDIAIYFILTVITQILLSTQDLKSSEKRVAILEKQFAVSQLNVLQSQLHPHFLFNTLNTLSTLLLKSAKADSIRMIDLLEKFLQATFLSRNEQMIPLSEEIIFIKNYLEIEKIRLGERLQVSLSLSQDSLSAYVPNLVLQPIVENALRHAISKRPDSGNLEIVSYIKNEYLHLHVIDDGPGMDLSNRNKAQKGVGIQITKERLRQLFGDRYTFSAVNNQYKGVNVEIAFQHVTANDIERYTADEK
jgi:sensor histidine kinase YesM